MAERDPFDDPHAPSEDDLARFGDAYRLCPQCKSEVYDENDTCHVCNYSFSSAEERVPKWAIAVAVALVAIIVAFMVF